MISPISTLADESGKIWALTTTLQTTRPIKARNITNTHTRIGLTMRWSKISTNFDCIKLFGLPYAMALIIICREWGLNCRCRSYASPGRFGSMFTANPNHFAPIWQPTFDKNSNHIKTSPGWDFIKLNISWGKAEIDWPWWRTRVLIISHHYE
jgi:hypothetical protein